MQGWGLKFAGVATIAATGALLLPAAAGATVLYEQTDHAATTTSNYQLPNFAPSNDFGPESSDGLVADDFTVPAGESWTIEQIDTTGATSGSPLQKVNVYFFRDSAGKPGGVFYLQSNVVAKETPNYSVPLTLPAGPIGPGTYWLAVQQAGANLTDFWSWGTEKVQLGSPAQFQSSGGAPGCPTSAWSPRMTCWTGNAPDQTFKLSGTVIGRAPPSSGDISFGKTKLNKKRGTAKLTVGVLSAGHIDLGGTGVSKQSADVTSAGSATIPVKPNGRVARKLKKGGKATVTVEVTFTASGATPTTETTKVKLKRGGK